MQLVKRSNGVGLDEKKLEQWDELTQKGRELEHDARELARKIIKKPNGHLPREK
jgi:hypothetical protein